MTKNENNLKFAQKARYAQKLDSKEIAFVEYLESLSKQELKNLSSKDFKELERISDLGVE